VISNVRKLEAEVAHLKAKMAEIRAAEAARRTGLDQGSMAEPLRKLVKRGFDARPSDVPGSYAAKKEAEKAEKAAK
jgi:hypothetical protein